MKQLRILNVEQPSLEDRLVLFKQMASCDKKEPTITEIQETFYPNC